MAKVVGKEILLDVAAEIEKDENYNGEQYWFADRNCGCAMVRIISRVTEIKGASPDSDGKVPEFVLDSGTRVFTESFIEETIAYITGISDRIWDRFRTFSLTADRFETAKALREIYADGDFKWEEPEWWAVEHTGW